MSGLLSFIQNLNNSGFAQGLANFGGTLAAQSGPGLQNHGQGLGNAIAAFGPGMLQGQQQNAQAAMLQGEKNRQNLWNEAFGPQQTNDDGTPSPLSPAAQQLQDAVPSQFRPIISALGPDRGGQFVAQLGMFGLQSQMMGGANNLATPEGVRQRAIWASMQGDNRGAASLIGQANQMDTDLLARQTGAKAGAEAPYQAPIEYDQQMPDGTLQHMTVPRQVWAQQAGVGTRNDPFSIVPEPLRPTTILAAQQAGLPPAAVPHWLATVQQESGFNPDAIGPVTASGQRAIGLGQVMPATGARLGYTPEQLKHPYPNALASATYFKQQWDAAGGNPIGAYQGYYGTGNAMPGQPTPQEYAQQVADRAQKIMGGQPQQAPVSTMQPQQPQAPVSTMQPAGIPGKVSLNPVQQQQLELQGKTYESDLKEMQEAPQEIQATQQTMTRLQQMRQIVNDPRLQSGAMGETRARLSNLLATLLPGQSAEKIQQLAGLPMASLAQELTKLGTQGAIGSEKDMGARGGVNLTKLISERGTPNVEMQATANQHIINSMLVTGQMNLNHDLAEQQHFASNQSKAGQPGQYQPLAQFEQQWQGVDRQKIAQAAVGAIDGQKGWDSILPPASKPEGLAARQEVIQFLRQMDPTIPIYHPNGTNIMRFGGG